MRSISFRPVPKGAQAGLVLLAIIFSLSQGSSYILASPLSPLIVAGGVLAAVLVVSSGRPAWALYAAVFVSSLPLQVVRLLPVAFLADYLITLTVLSLDSRGF